MVHRQPLKHGFAWLEVLLAIAAGALVMQLWPQLGRAIWRMIDIRSWSSKTWMLLNLFVILGLISARFGPQFYAEWRQRQGREGHTRQREDEARGRKERREAIERAKKARRRYF